MDETEQNQLDRAHRMVDEHDGPQRELVNKLFGRLQGEIEAEGDHELLAELADMTWTELRRERKERGY